jgi:hypothetical protein
MAVVSVYHAPENKYGNGANETRRRQEKARTGARKCFAFNAAMSSTPNAAENLKERSSINKHMNLGRFGFGREMSLPNNCERYTGEMANDAFIVARR